MSKIATSLLLVAFLALGCAAQQAAAPGPQPPAPAEPPTNAAAAPMTEAAPPAEGAAPLAQAAPAAQAETAQAAPAETAQAAPAVAATAEAPAGPGQEARKAKRACPQNPAEGETYVGPYWTEERLPSKPFICPNYSYPEKAVRKLGRGLANVVTSPIEIINQPLNSIYRTESAGSISNATACLVGIPLGVGWTVYRALAGVFDVVTFPLPFYKPIIKPEFVSNDFQKRRVLQIKTPEQIKRRLDEYKEN